MVLWQRRVGCRVFQRTGGSVGLCPLRLLRSGRMAQGAAWVRGAPTGRDQRPAPPPWPCSRRRGGYCLPFAALVRAGSVASSFPQLILQLIFGNLFSGLQAGVLCASRGGSGRDSQTAKVATAGVCRVGMTGAPSALRGLVT